MPDLISQRLTFMIPVASEALPHILSGKLRALAVTGNQRMKALPDVPTMSEEGVGSLEGIIWWGLFAPAKTPQPTVDRLSKELMTVLENPDVAAGFANLGIEPAPLTSAEFAKFYKSEISNYADVAREYNLAVK